MRLLCAVNRLPTPLHPDVRMPSLTCFGTSLMRLTERLLTSWNIIPEADLEALPTYLLEVFASGILTARRSSLYVAGRPTKSAYGDFDHTTLDRAEARLQTCGSLGHRVMTASRATVGAFTGTTHPIMVKSTGSHYQTLHMATQRAICQASRAILFWVLTLTSTLPPFFVIIISRWIPPLQREFDEILGKEIARQGTLARHSCQDERSIYFYI